MHPEFPFCFKWQSCQFHISYMWFSTYYPTLGITESSRVGKAAPWVRRTGWWWNRRVPNMEANMPQFLLLPRERVCKSVIRNGKRPKGMGGPPKAVIWMPKYLAPALQGAACKCFRGRASCGLWFRELTQIVSGPFFMGLRSSVLPGEPEPVLLGVIPSCLAGSRLCAEQAVMAVCQKGS